jgi:hypothetical protein
MIGGKDSWYLKSDHVSKCIDGHQQPALTEHSSSQNRNSRENHVQSLDIKAVCSSIALQNPYFAFLDLDRQSDVGVRGTFAAEHSTGHERGPVAAAELVCHLAILGSCAAVVNGASAPAYYLGTKGRLKLPATFV